LGDLVCRQAHQVKGSAAHYGSSGGQSVQDTENQPTGKPFLSVAKGEGAPWE